ncbi:MAG: hypothetical protein ACI4KA_09085 [Oscillospiraceae bacterium]
MTEQIRTYLQYLRAFMAEEHTVDEFCIERAKLLKRIELYQHERLVHLLVTLAFAIFFMLSLFMLLLIGGIGLFILTFLFLVLLVPYIKHYYFLENSVQELYKIYYKMED